jgi:tetraacyldisaccharide 4'-kinase
MMDIEGAVRTVAVKPVFFTTISYGNPISFGKEGVVPEREVILITGIAQPRTIVDYVRKHFTLVDHLDFADHYHYKKSDFERFVSLSKAHPGISFLTTEKDMVKLSTIENASYLSELSIHYLPIAVRFLKSEEDFCELVIGHVRKKSPKTAS